MFILNIVNKIYINKYVNKKNYIFHEFYLYVKI